jgi:uncharacterized protein YukE
MGMQNSEIQLRYRQTIQQIRTLGEITQSLRQCVTDNFGRVLTRVGSSWKGCTADRYLKRGRRLQKKYLEELDQMDQELTALRLAARRIYETEMRNAACAASGSKRKC